MQRPSRQVVYLIFCGLICEAIYLGLAFRVPWPVYGHQLRSWSALLGRGEAVLPVYLAAVACLFGAYAVGWQVLRKLVAAPRWVLWAGAIAFSATLFWVYPITCDLFDYLGSAHLLTDIGANPLLVSRSAFPNHAFFQAYATPYTNSPSAYGPLWNLLAAPATLGAHDGTFGLVWLKGLAVASFLACAWLVERIAAMALPPSPPIPERRSVQPAAAALYLFAWNPLVLGAAVGDGHNDLAMMALVLVSLWGLLRRRPVIALVALTLSAGVKYVSALLLPVWGLYVWRTTPAARRRPGLTTGIALSIVAAVAMMAPFWDRSLVPTLLERLLTPDTWTVAPERTARWLMGAGLVVLAGLCAAQVLRLNRALQDDQTAPAALVETSFTLLLFTFLLGAARSQAWHLLWPLALAPLVVARSLRAATAAAVVSLGALSALMLASLGWVEWGRPGPWVWPAVGAGQVLALGLFLQQYIRSQRRRRIIQ